MNKREVKMLEFPQRGDKRGHLVIVEGMKDVPFDIKRIFYIYGSDKDVVRGQHANLKSQFVLVNVAGKSKVRVKDGLGNEAVFSLNRAHTGIYLPEMICMILAKIQFCWCFPVNIMIQRNISETMIPLLKWYIQKKREKKNESFNCDTSLLQRR